MSNKKIALIVGVRGQDGSYLSELLLGKDYRVIGMDRRVSHPSVDNLKNVIGNPNFVYEQGDVTDFASVARILQQYPVDELYELAAQSFVAASWTQPLSTININFNGVANCLEAIRLFSPKTKLYFAGTSERYGDTDSNFQDENTTPCPRSPYSAAKVAAEYLIKVYRDSYGLFASIGILQNHESPRRGKEFVTRKITDWVGRSFNTVEQYILDGMKANAGNYFISTDNAFRACLEKGLITKLRMGDTSTFRDFSDSRDMVRGMWMILQYDKPDTFVLASGKATQIKEFIQKSFEVVGVKHWEDYVETDPKFLRPAEVNFLCGNSAKARDILGWVPEISLDQMISEMVKNDIELNRI